jgi:hypothetical protein
VTLVRVALILLLLAGCGGSALRISEDHATLTDVDVHDTSVVFTFDVPPDKVTARYTPRSALAECGSGAPVRPAGSAFFVVHFTPAQSRELPKRFVMPSGPLREVAKVCDFEADLGWVIGLDRRVPADVSTRGSAVTVTFGG